MSVAPSSFDVCRTCHGDENQIGNQTVVFKGKLYSNGLVEDPKAGNSECCLCSSFPGIPAEERTKNIAREHINRPQHQPRPGRGHPSEEEEKYGHGDLPGQRALHVAIDISDRVNRMGVYPGAAHEEESLTCCNTAGAICIIGVACFSTRAAIECETNPRKSIVKALIVAAMVAGLIAIIATGSGS